MAAGSASVGPFGAPSPQQYGGPDAPHAQALCESVVNLVRRYLEDGDVQVLPEDIAAGPVRTLRFRPSMGWVRTGV